MRSRGQSSAFFKNAEVSHSNKNKKYQRGRFEVTDYNDSGNEPGLNDSDSVKRNIEDVWIDPHNQMVSDRPSKRGCFQITEMPDDKNEMAANTAIDDVRFIDSPNAYAQTLTPVRLGRFEVTDIQEPINGQLEDTDCSDFESLPCPNECDSLKRHIDDVWVDPCAAMIPGRPINRGRFEITEIPDNKTEMASNTHVDAHFAASPKDEEQKLTAVVKLGRFEITEWRDHDSDGGCPSPKSFFLKRPTEQTIGRFRVTTVDAENTDPTQAVKGYPASIFVR